jgi:putative ABC transport system permease protein
MLLRGNVKMAVDSIRRTRWRSFLTMLGIVIGIVSVVTIMSIGEGVRRQISRHVNGLSEDVITIRSGKVSTNARDVFDGLNSSFVAGASTLTDQDVTSAQATPGVQFVAPISLLTTTPKTETTIYEDAMVMASTPLLKDIVNRPLAYGSFFDPRENNRFLAVIGKRVAERLFGENVPIGRLFTLHGQEFVVRGIFDEFDGNGLNVGVDFNKAIIIPAGVSTNLNGQTPQISEILIKPAEGAPVEALVQDVRRTLNTTHGGEDDFSVLRQRDNVEVVSDTIYYLTLVLAAVAGVSLFVAGIGIMNIMIVSVTERTHEIGIRKAIGATNRQVLNQFLVESSILSLAGGFVGVAAAVLANYFIRIWSPLEPVITWPVMVGGVSIALVIGILFGTAPALRAARKDPIKALRYE